MELKSPTDEPISFALLSGHGIRIGPEGREVPQMFIKEAFAHGAIPVGVDASEFSESESGNSGESQPEEILIDGIKKMLVENAKDFTGAGLPNRNVLSGIVGWNVSVQELSAAWAKVQEAA